MPNPRNRPGKGLGSTNNEKPKVRAQAGSGRGGGLAKRAPDNAPSSGPKKPQKGNPRAKPGGQMVSAETKTPQTQKSSGPPSGGGNNGGRSGPPSRGGGASGGRPQGGGQPPAKRGNTQPARRPSPGPRGSVWGGNLSAADPPAKRPSDIMDNLFFDALRNADSAAGALFRTILRGAAGPAGVATDMAMSPELNKGEATENPQGDSPYPNAKQQARGEQALANSELPIPSQGSQSSGESGQSGSGGDMPKPDQKPSQGSQDGSQGQGGGGQSTLPDDASLGDKIAWGQRNGHPVIEHEGRVYKQDSESPTGYRFAGQIGGNEGQASKSGGASQGSPASGENSSYGMSDFWNDLKEGPSPEEAERIQKRFDSPE